MVNLDYEVRSNRGYYEVYINGDLYCCADNFCEAIREVEDYEKEQHEKEEGK